MHRVIFPSRTSTYSTVRPSGILFFLTTPSTTTATYRTDVNRDYNWVIELSLAGEGLCAGPALSACLDRLADDRP